MRRHEEQTSVTYYHRPSKKTLTILVTKVKRQNNLCSFMCVCVCMCVRRCMCMCVCVCVRFCMCLMCLNSMFDILSMTIIASLFSQAKIWVKTRRRRNRNVHYIIHRQTPAQPSPIWHEHGDSSFYVYQNQYTILPKRSHILQFEPNVFIFHTVWFAIQSMKQEREGLEG